MMNSPEKKLIVCIVGVCCCVSLLWFFYFHSAFKAAPILNAYEKNSKQINLTITYPFNETVFPPELSPPTFRWNEAGPASDEWLISIRFTGTKGRMNAFVRQPEWKPSKKQWETIKKRSREQAAHVAVIGLCHAAGNRIASSAEIVFTTSKDSVGNPLFYREVVLPFSEAVKDPSRLRWRFGTIDGEQQPPVVLENLPVCGNCHSFSCDGKTLGMDVDYANDKGAYTVTALAREMNLVTSDIITWSDFRRDENDPTFGLLSQVSPDGRFVVSTVKDRSVFVAKPDRYFSQLFFPIQGILAVYTKATKSFQALPGADNPALVQSNPSWSPDGKFIVFARSAVYRLKKLRNKAQVLLSPEECSEFLTNQVQFKYDLYRIPFNGGNGGVAEPLTGASNNGMSNFFAKYSPDGRWIVFCKSASFMLLQPDSKLYIMPAGGGEPHDVRLMRCNTGRMNSWHTWSSNSRWLVFSSKQNSPYTQLFITHIDERGNDAPPVLLEHLTQPDRAANIPEFVYNDPHAIAKIHERFIDDVSLWRAGKSFEEAGDTENAGIKYAKALELNPNNVKAHVSLGNILENRGYTDSALMHYTKAVQMDSSYAIARINVGNIFFKKGDMPGAIIHYTAAVRLAPDNAYAEYNLAQAYFTLGNYPEALAHFTAAMRLMPDDALTRFGLGNTFVKTGRTNEAILQFAKGADLLPDDPDCHHLLAEALVTAGRLYEAVAVYRKALRLIPGNPQLRFYLANLLRKRHETRESTQLYEEALKIKPDFKEAQDSLAVLQGKR
ncbi:MAG: tetratricopeptide repeat protein [Chitinispirillaceae bacterium]|jgi:tetratricopeptide (TPR) repeat protein